MKKNIAILFGGNSTEHEISIKSTEFIFKTLDTEKYNLKLIYISKENHWYVPIGFINSFPNIQKLWNDFPVHKISEEFLKEFLKLNPVIHSKFIEEKLQDIDLCFLGLHGGDGENGKLQAFLEFLKIPYTGSGIQSSAIAMDKEKSNLLFKSNSMNVADFLNLKKTNFTEDYNEKNLDLKFPIFIKPNSGGSSVGVSKVLNLNELNSKLKTLFLTEMEIILQEYISGIEVSCGVIEDSNRNIIKLFPTEIIPDNDFFDYESKYKLGKAKEITPARINKILTDEVRNNAEKAHRVLGCTGYSRSDFIIKENEVYILETNTLPGMTETSLIPEQVKFSGLEMKKVFDDLILIGFKEKI